LSLPESTVTNENFITFLLATYSSSSSSSLKIKQGYIIQYYYTCLFKKSCPFCIEYMNGIQPESHKNLISSCSPSSDMLVPHN
jgi:hypothetical protein